MVILGLFALPALALGLIIWAELHGRISHLG